jgi:U3 small nucleolar RNA-associated protein 11
MSDRSFRNATKNRREHRERAQPAHRAALGPLEKKKDYRVRAKRTHLKEDILKKLREKAAMKNPDEFYFGMANAKRLVSKFLICTYSNRMDNT